MSVQCVVSSAQIKRFLVFLEALPSLDAGRGMRGIRPTFSVDWVDEVQWYRPDTGGGVYETPERGPALRIAFRRDARASWRVLGFIDPQSGFFYTARDWSTPKWEIALINLNSESDDLLNEHGLKFLRDTVMTAGFHLTFGLRP